MKTTNNIDFAKGYALALFEYAIYLTPEIAADEVCDRFEIKSIEAANEIADYIVLHSDTSEANS